jgi:hypothetical protein
MSLETLNPALEIPAPNVAIVADYHNIDYALPYEERLHELGANTEWVFEPEMLVAWRKLASAAKSDPENSRAIRHPYAYSAQYRHSVEDTLKNPRLREGRLAIVRGSDVVLGINRGTFPNTRDLLAPITTDYLVMGIALGKIVFVSEAFPTIAFPDVRGSYHHSYLNERGLQLKALGIKRAQGDMGKVYQAYEERLKRTGAKETDT